MQAFYLVTATATHRIKEITSDITGVTWTARNSIYTTKTNFLQYCYLHISKTRLKAD
jgi:hypothetical protein